MKLCNRLIAKILMLIAIMLVTFIIFFNSFKDVVASHQASDMVVDIIVSEQSVENDRLNLIVRKMAHLIEYAALGIAVMLFVIFFEKDCFKKLYGTALFYVLFIAVLDEYIQSFFNRTSSIGDVLLDFFGALIGGTVILVIHIIYALLKKRKNRINKAKYI